ncbi:alcohol dehydrogenase catalytic domain-containing protein, partial [Escherichia coli]|uniref:alcohol dehydrogenase catalytic domain-containing protein n=1 Tax=Escherichia coli TaxID=562 RepID=UPI003B9BBB5D
MKAFVASPQGAVAAEVPMPRPKPNEVLVKVHACGLNRADLGMASGHAHGARGGAGTVVGMEWAGEVVECGRDVQGVRVGDKVMCSGGGGFAEYAVTDMGRAMPFPDAKLAMT